MAINFNTTPDLLARRLTEGLHGEIEKAIREQVQKHADKFIANAARELAQSIKGAVHAYYDTPNGLTITLVIDGKKEGIA